MKDSIKKEIDPDSNNTFNNTYGSIINSANGIGLGIIDSDSNLNSLKPNSHSDINTPKKYTPGD
ncbi:hypothetical protein [Clostridium sp. C8-1-8]|jgi:hypothetical protein|uniref:hypothetical protein n=1 Tax=Clostridium sp. C8-1-8 TaxID=2698831 RepID=UPI00136D1D10|nr:hypothetical protein [Clostridium sp. C8-1-8]